jgi:phage-related holin
MDKIRYKKILILILVINKILFIIANEEIDILYNKSSIGFYKTFS